MILDFRFIDNLGAWYVNRNQSECNAMTLFLGRKILNTSIVKICERNVSKLNG